jgi:putative intracellular protease/amidase
MHTFTTNQEADMPTLPKVLFVTTSHSAMGASGAPTGVWFEELATPYFALIDAGLNVDIVSILGGAVPIDPRSQKAAGENAPSVERFLNTPAAMATIGSTPAIGAANASDYDAVFLPGGHGTMWDLPESDALASAISAIFERGGAVAAVCHGAAGLVSAERADGTPLVAGRRVSAFTDAEEHAAGLAGVVPFLLQTRLIELGAHFEGGPDFQAFAIADGQLVTGQNPASSQAVVRLLIERLNTKLAA